MHHLGWSREKGIATRDEMKIHPRGRNPKPEAIKGKHFQEYALNMGRMWESRLCGKELMKA